MIEPDDAFSERSLPMKFNKNLGMLLTSVWLIVTGLIPLLHLSFSGLGTDDRPCDRRGRFDRTGAIVEWSGIACTVKNQS